MNKTLILVAIVALSACKMTDEKDNQLVEDHHQSLAWASSADVDQDIEKAREAGDYRLMMVASRGQVLPGIPVEQRPSLIEQCGSQYIPGSTDVIKDQKHRERLKQAIDYAKQYNQAMAKHCSAQKQ